MADKKQPKSFEQAVHSYKRRHADATDEDITLIMRETDLGQLFAWGFSKEDEEDVRIIVENQPKLVPASGTPSALERKRPQSVRFEQPISSSPLSKPQAAAQPLQQETPSSSSFPFSHFEPTTTSSPDRVPPTTAAAGRAAVPDNAPASTSTPADIDTLRQAAEVASRTQAEDAEQRHRQLQKQFDELTALHSRCGPMWRDLAVTQLALSDLQGEKHCNG